MKFRCLFAFLGTFPRKFLGVLALPLVPLLLALPRPAIAGPTLYNIQFNGVETFPASGFFRYDATSAAFSGFVVNWSGQQYDLTSAANEPTVGSACGGPSSSGATTFALLSHSLCGGLYYRWFGSSNPFSSDFSFHASTLALPEQLAAHIAGTGGGSASPSGDAGAGDWTIAAITHVINFTGGSTLPTVGYASYDATASHFDLLTVFWGGHWYDLTGQANAPTTGAGCPGSTSAAATTFALLSHALCGGLYYRWLGSAEFDSSDFSFHASTLALPEQLGARIAATGPGTGSPLHDFSGGDWTFTAIAVPEPASALMLLGGLLLVARWVRRARPAASR